MTSQSLTYYISPNGKDNNTGILQNSAWNSIEKVNQTQFQPGDRILFASNGIWYGNLNPQGSGKQGNHIRISSYGEGAMPIINIGEKSGAGIKLINQSWWEVCGIEIMSRYPPQVGVKREGISVKIESGGKCQGIIIRDCYIHDIWGQCGGDANSRMIDISPENLLKNPTLVNNLNDVIVENNIIKRCDKVGILVAGKSNIIVRRNFLENLGGDGIIVGGANRGLVEQNIANRTCLRSGDPDIPHSKDWWPHTAAIWLIWCEETIMQFNEVYNTGRQILNGDGFAYDFDFECKKCILQYNYSANNHGLVLFMNRTYENITRFNISQNDQTHLIQIHGNIQDGNIIHNNIFYVDHSTIDIDYHMGLKEKSEEDKVKLGAIFKNNIFYATGQGRFQTVYSHGEAWERTFLTEQPSSQPNTPTFQHNCYFGPWLNEIPDDPEKMVVDPKLVEAGSGKIGLATLSGYKLKSDSPCLDAGAFLDKDWTV